MKESIEQAYPQCIRNGCLEVHFVSQFGIYEDEQKRCCITQNEFDQVQFTVLNPRQKAIHFLAIDKCLFSDHDPSKCDCAVFDVRTFTFLELKRVGRKLRNQSKTEAVIQLKSTIRQFQAQLDFSSYQLEACICVGWKATFPTRTTSKANTALIFQNELNTTLLEGNSKKFE